MLAASGLFSWTEIELLAFASHLFAPYCLDYIFYSMPLVSERVGRNRRLHEAPCIYLPLANHNLATYRKTLPTSFLVAAAQSKQADEGGTPSRTRAVPRCSVARLCDFWPSACRLYVLRY